MWKIDYNNNTENEFIGDVTATYSNELDQVLVSITERVDLSNEEEKNSFLERAKLKLTEYNATKLKVQTVVAELSTLINK